MYVTTPAVASVTYLFVYARKRVRFFAQNTPATTSGAMKCDP